VIKVLRNIPITGLPPPAPPLSSNWIGNFFMPKKLCLIQGLIQKLDWGGQIRNIWRGGGLGNFREQRKIYTPATDISEILEGIFLFTFFLLFPFIFIIFPFFISLLKLWVGGNCPLKIWGGGCPLPLPESAPGLISFRKVVPLDSKVLGLTPLPPFSVTGHFFLLAPLALLFMSCQSWHHASHFQPKHRILPLQIPVMSQI